MRYLTALAIFTCVAPGPSFGWGEDGHVIVGKIAEANLNPTAKAKIKDLLDDRSIGDARLSTWADKIRSSGELKRKYENNDKWHYININIDVSTKAEDFKPDPSDDHVIMAVEKFKKVLVDESASKEDRKEALLFVIHFVGDLHQPLHTCFRNDDRGGNLQPIKSYAGKTENKLNLHWIWDTHLLRAEKGVLTPEDFATRLDGETTVEQRDEWAKGTVKDWVWDSHAVAAKTVYRFADGTDLPARDKPAIELTEENYGKANRPIVREQLKKGGVRLAKVLNDCFPEPK
jgi:nuclease S1